MPITDKLKPKNEKKTPAFLTPVQLDRLLTCIDAHVALLKDQPGPNPDVQWLPDAIEIAAGTGLRRGELLNLRWEDIDLRARRLYVVNRNGFKTKSGQERIVPVRGAALRVLRRRHEESDGAGPVLTDRDGLPVKPVRLSHRFKDMVRKAKLRGREDMRFHSLRHSCGAWLASQGVSSRIIQEILGHVTPRTTEIYSHLMGPAVEDAMERTFGE